MGSKYNFLVVFLLCVICFLFAAIYFQSITQNKSESGIVNTIVGNISEIQKDHPAKMEEKNDSGKIYYIDYTKGNNSAAGTSMEKAWKDFANIKIKPIRYIILTEIGNKGKYSTIFIVIVKLIKAIVNSTDNSIKIINNIFIA